MSNYFGGGYIRGSQKCKFNILYSTGSEAASVTNIMDLDQIEFLEFCEDARNVDSMSHAEALLRLHYPTASRVELQMIAAADALADENCSGRLNY